MPPSDVGFDLWLRRPASFHLGGLLALILLALLRYGPLLLDGTPHDDEEIYLASFERVRQGDSPYEALGYFYPPFFAQLGAAATGLVGTEGMLALLRSTNLVGLSLVIWCSLAWLQTGIQWLWLAGGIVLALAPGVSLGLRFGNLSFAVAGSILLALLLAEASCRTARRSPRWTFLRCLAGALLGLGIALKPVAAVLPLLLATRPADAEGRRRPVLLVALVAVAVAGPLLLSFPGLDTFLSLADDPGSKGRSTSLMRLLYCFGLQPPATAVLLGVALLSAAWAWRRRLASAPFIGLATTTALLATPIVWSHTLLLALPTQILALQRLVARRREGVASGYELAVLLAAVAALQLSEGVGGIENQPLPLQGLVVAIPCLAPVALTLYLFYTERSTGAS